MREAGTLAHQLEKCDANSIHPRTRNAALVANMNRAALLSG